MIPRCCLTENTKEINASKWKTHVHVSQACAPCGLKVNSVECQYFVLALSSLIREKICASLRLLIVVIFDQVPPEKKKKGFYLTFHHSEKSWSELLLKQNLLPHKNRYEAWANTTKRWQPQRSYICIIISKKSIFFVSAFVLVFCTFCSRFLPMHEPEMVCFADVRTRPFIFQNKPRLRITDNGWGHTWAFFTIINESLPW